MTRLTFLVPFVVVMSLFAAVPALQSSAQDASPAAGSPNTMSLEETRAVIDAYLAALVAREDIAPFFKDDVVLELVDVGQRIQGRDAVAGVIVGWQQQSFDARPELTNLIVGEGTAANEAGFFRYPTPGIFRGSPRGRRLGR